MRKEQSYELQMDELPEYMVGIFRALLKNEKFRVFLNDNFIIRHWVCDGDLVRVEITDKKTSNNFLN